MGPGKAELLEAIDATGSISAAAREMRNELPPGWLLVQTMNACFAEPVVESATGGTHGGGASLTAAGVAALAAYRNMVRRADELFRPLLATT